MKPTFEAAAMATLETLRSTWRTDKTETDWLRAMNNYVMPKIGDKRIDLIDRADILGILVPLWTEKHETGRRVRAWMKSVFSWAQAHGHIETNLACEAISGALPKGAGKKTNYRALHHSEVSEALNQTDKARACKAAKVCLRFIALTAARSNEARGATWSEIDLENKVWRIPASRMKSSKEHRVPLAPAALEVLEQAAELRDKSDLVFPSPTNYGKPLSDAMMMLLLQKAGLADRATAHGFRSSFRDWAADTGKPREIAEAALSHIVQGVEGHYFRTDLFDRRRGMMEAWADYLTGAMADVVRIHG